MEQKWSGKKKMRLVETGRERLVEIRNLRKERAWKRMRNFTSMEVYPPARKKILSSAFPTSLQPLRRSKLII